MQALLEIKSVRMDVRVGGCLEPIDLRSYLLEAMREHGVAVSGKVAQQGITVEHAAAVAPEDGESGAGGSKFQSSLKELLTGEPQDAALGVTHLVRASPAQVRVGMMRGLDEIEAEFEAFRQVTVAEAAATLAKAVAPPDLPADAMPDPPPWWMAAEIGDEAYECMHYCIHEAAGSSSKVFPNSSYARDRDSSGVCAERVVAASGEGMCLADFCALPEARTANLEPAHVAALRIYSTAAFKVLNGPLRQPWGEQPHPFPVTVSFLSDAIGKLRAVSAAQPDAHVASDLWRGMRDLAPSADFLARGGTEQAPMSTTSDIRVALAYSAAGTTAHALLFKLRSDTFMGRGASLRFLSAFPAESEILFPPLTYLKPSGKRPEVVRCDDGRQVTVVEIVPHLGSV